MRSSQEMLDAQLENGEFIAEDFVYCPECGHEHDDPYHQDEGEDEYECEHCGKTFLVDTVVSITYSTSRIKDDKGESE